ncbi:MAG: glycosyltransferase family 9 protein [Lentisphaeria bacterium]|nr:glycosyltransferase family 9 protein [Lentisphaeria bacterium]
MEIGYLRSLDRCCGVPLCALLTMVHRVCRLCVPWRLPESPRAFLFIKLFGLGSMVLTLPCVAAVRRRFPEAALFYLTFRDNGELLEMTGLVPPEGIVTIRTDSCRALLGSAVSAWRVLSRRRVDVVVDFEFFSRFTALFGRMLRPRWLIGFSTRGAKGMWRGAFLDSPVCYNHMLHASRAFFSLLRPLGVEPGEYRADLPALPASDPDSRRKSPGPSGRLPPAGPDTSTRWIVVNPWSSRLLPQRDWPVEHVIRLIARLLKELPEHGFALVGTGDQTSTAEAVLRPFRAASGAPRVVNLVGRTSLGDLVAVLRRADVLVTVDSGPAHLASLTRTPTVVLFGPETAQLYRPLGEQATTLSLDLDCRPCVHAYNGKRCRCRDNLCMQGIDPETVCDAVRERLATATRDRCGPAPAVICGQDRCRHAPPGAPAPPETPLPSSPSPGRDGL